MTEEILDLKESMTNISNYSPHIEKLLEMTSLKDEETLIKYLFRGWYMSQFIDEKSLENTCFICLRPFEEKRNS